ncbi:MAG: hypothetical protein J1E85_01540 [Ruminococcus sp.]|nr:hypothetical protein [Ruminococcus sp.]
MDDFYNALISDTTDKIPEEYDWFAPLLGDWDFDYYDQYDKNEPRHVKGEWIFRRILEGAGINDLFICPSRAERKIHPQPDAEYGTAIRMFNPHTKVYDMFYTTFGFMTRVTFVKENGMLVGKPEYDENARWVFSEITENTFHWQNITIMENGDWRINSNVYAKRK